MVPAAKTADMIVSNESGTHRKGNIVNKRDVTTIKILSGRSFVVQKGCGDVGIDSHLMAMVAPIDSG